MRTIKITLVFLFLFLINSTFSQWTRTNGPNSAVIDYIATTGDNIYFISYSDGIYLSTNRGLQWTSVRQGIPPQLVLLSLAADGNNVFVYCTDTINGTQAGLYRSTNMGMNWSLNIPMTSYQGIGRILINNGRIMCSARLNPSDKLLLSSNNGASWDTINAPVNPLAANGNIVYAASNSTMARSSDNGLTWINLPTAPYDVGSVAIKNNIIFAGILYEGTPVYSSTDNGTSWNASSSGIPADRRVSSLAVIGNNIYASTYVNNDAFGGIYKSTDDGSNWVPGGLPTMYISSLGVISNELYAGSVHGFFSSTDLGTNWTASNNGLPFLNVGQISFNGNRIFVGTLTGVYYTTNNGDNWLISTYLYGGLLSVNSYGSRVVGADYKGSYYSLDNGETWSILLRLPGGVPRIATAASTGSTFLVCEYWTINPNSGYLHVTSNNGANWTINTQPTARCFVNNGFNVFSGTNAGVFLSTNGGFNWTAVNSGLTSTDILSFAANGNFIVAGTNGNGPFLSTNNGANWVAINSGISSSSVYSLAIKGNTIFAGTNLQPNKIFMSVNMGVSWVGIDDNLANFSVNALSIDSNYLYVATGTTPGVWKRPLSRLTGGIQPSQNNIPDKFSLEQNYPNPFNPSTKIRFGIPSNGKDQTSNVKIVIYDALGREVLILVNEQLKPGTYEAEWNASNFPSGVYYYKLIAQNYTETKKMVLLK